MKYKLLALDIDGTLVTDGSHTMSPALVEALKKAAKHVKISYVTARSRREAQEFLDILGAEPEYHVLENGAKVLQPDGSLAYDLHIPHDEVQEILDHAAPFFTEVGFCTDDHWQEGIDCPQDDTVNGLSFSCVGEEEAHFLKQTVDAMGKKYATYIVEHWNIPEWKGVLVFHENGTKGAGMKYIQEKLGITPEETIAIGDGGTDISMFDQAGLKVAMENGMDDVKQASDVIAPSVHEDGVVTVIEKYITNQT